MDTRLFRLVSTVSPYLLTETSSKYDSVYQVVSRNSESYARLIVSCVQGLGYEYAFDQQLGSGSGVRFLEDLYKIITENWDSAVQRFNGGNLPAIKEQLKRLLIDRSEFCFFTCNGLNRGHDYHNPEIMVFMSPLGVEVIKPVFVCPTCESAVSFESALQVLSAIQPFPTPLPAPLAQLVTDWANNNGFNFVYTGLPIAQEATVCDLVDGVPVYTPPDTLNKSDSLLTEPSLGVTDSIDYEIEESFSTYRYNPDPIQEEFEDDEDSEAETLKKLPIEKLEETSGNYEEDDEESESGEDDDDDLEDAPIDKSELLYSKLMSQGLNPDKVMIIPSKPPTDADLVVIKKSEGYGEQDVVITSMPAIQMVALPTITKVETKESLVGYIDSNTPEDGCIRDVYRGPKLSGETVAKGRSKNGTVVLSLDCGPTMESSLGYWDIVHGDIKVEPPFVCNSHLGKKFPIYVEDTNEIPKCPKCDKVDNVVANPKVGQPMARKIVRLQPNGTWEQVNEPVPKPTGKEFASRFEWQNFAVDRWVNGDNGWCKFKVVGHWTRPRPANYNGIIEATTGSGKTKMVIKCIDRLLKDRGPGSKYNEDISVTIIVPASKAVQYQWFCELQKHGLKDDKGNPVREFGPNEIALFGGDFGEGDGYRKLINLYVVNTAVGKSAQEDGESSEEEDLDISEEDLSAKKSVTRKLASPLLLRHLFGEWTCDKCGQPAQSGDITECRKCRETRGSGVVVSHGQLKSSTKHFLVCDELHRYSPKAKLFSKIFDAPIDYSLLVTGTMISGEYIHVRCKQCDKEEKLTFSLKVNSKGELIRELDPGVDFKGIKLVKGGGTVLFCRKHKDEAPNPNVGKKFADINKFHDVIDVKTGTSQFKLIPFINFYQQYAGPVLALYTYPEALWKRNISPFRMWFVGTPIEKTDALMLAAIDMSTFTKSETKQLNTMLKICSQRRVHELARLTQYILDYKGTPDFVRNLKMLVFSKRLEPIKIIHKYLVNTVKSEGIPTERRIGAYHSMMSDYFLPCSTDPILPVTQKFALTGGNPSDPGELGVRFIDIPAISIYANLISPIKKNDTHFVIRLDDFRNGATSRDLVVHQKYVSPVKVVIEKNVAKVISSFNTMSDKFPTKLLAVGSFPGRAKIGSMIEVVNPAGASEWAYIVATEVQKAEKQLIEVLTLSKELTNVIVDSTDPETLGFKIYVLNPIQELPAPLGVAKHRRHHEVLLSPHGPLKFITSKEKKYLKSKGKTKEEVDAYVKANDPERTSYDKLEKIKIEDPVCPFCMSKGRKNGLCGVCKYQQQVFDKFYRVWTAEQTSGKRKPIKKNISAFSEVLISQNSEYDVKTLQNAYMDEFRVPISASEEGSGTVQIMLSGKALVEGIDVPDVDIGVAFSPMSKDNSIPNLQSLGRVLRVKKFPPGAVDKDGNSIAGEIIPKDYIVFFNQEEERVIKVFSDHLQLLIDNEPEWVCLGGAPHTISYEQFFEKIRNYYEGSKPVVTAKEGTLITKPELTFKKVLDWKDVDEVHDIFLKAPVNFQSLEIKSDYRLLVWANPDSMAFNFSVKAQPTAANPDMLKLDSFPPKGMEPKMGWELIQAFNNSPNKKWVIEKDFPVDRKLVTSYVYQVALNFTMLAYKNLFPEQEGELQVTLKIFDEEIQKLEDLVEGPNLYTVKVPQNCLNHICKKHPCVQGEYKPIAFGKTEFVPYDPPIPWSRKEYINHLIDDEKLKKEKAISVFNSKSRNATKRWRHFEKHNPSVVSRIANTPDLPVEIEKKFYCDLAELRTAGKVEELQKLYKEIISGKKFLPGTISQVSVSEENYFRVARYVGCDEKQRTRGRAAKFKIGAGGLEIAVAEAVKYIAKQLEAETDSKAVYLIKEVPDGRVYDSVGNLIIPGKLDLINKYVVASGPFQQVFADVESAKAKAQQIYKSLKCETNLTYYKTVDNVIVAEVIATLGGKPGKVKKAIEVSKSVKPTVSAPSPTSVPTIKEVAVTLSDRAFAVWEDAACQIPAVYSSSPNKQIGADDLVQLKTLLTALSEKTSKNYFISVEKISSGNKPFGLFKDLACQVPITNTTSKGSKHLVYAEYMSAIFAAKMVSDKATSNTLGGITVPENNKGPNLFISNLPGDIFLFEDAACKNLWFSNTKEPYIFTKGNNEALLKAIKDISINKDFKLGNAVLVIYFARAGLFRLYNQTNIDPFIAQLEKQIKK